jgi:hypothetical protein
VQTKQCVECGAGFVAVGNHKTCGAECGADLHRRSGRRGSHTWHETRSPEQRQYHAEYAKAWRLRTKYGMEPADYARMLNEQGGVCAICSAVDRVPGRALSVDHDHTTGRVRGLLCTTCNSGVGQFYDDPALLEAAIRYLGTNG